MIGIVTALPKEYAAMEAMLDNSQDYTAPGSGAGRRYRRGAVPSSEGAPHTVLLALADMGNNVAAIRASLMLQHFPDLKHVIMVGIAGGVPHPTKVEDHVRLGDVVVSGQGGVAQYDFDKEEYDFKEHRPVIKYRNPPRPPSALLLEAVRLLSAHELGSGRVWLANIARAAKLLNVQRPLDEADQLYASDDAAQVIPHPIDPQREPSQPRLFAGSIASANKLLKNPKLRDALRDQFGVKAVEMEGSGIADATWTHEVGYLVVRGICDYCDGHKNDAWQGYAAVVAAAYTRGLLASMPGEEQEAPSQGPGVASSYNPAVLRELLNAAFSDEELITLCFDRFSEVYNNFSAGMSKGQKIQQLLDYCMRREQLPALVTAIQVRNPAQYKRYEGRLGGTSAGRS